MFRVNENKAEIYWKSYRLLEEQLLRLSHSITFDDGQINVYSTELADIINSACVKIESISKDIYENHVLPFQLDNDIIPITFKKKNFNIEKWKRENWKFDYNCLVEIDEKYNISSKAVRLKLEKFNFHKYGSYILPFYNLKNDHKGGKWEYCSHDVFESLHTKHFEDINWCDSYQQIKHNYIDSIKEQGTIKNAIITLSAFYVLLIYNSCLPFKQLDLNTSKNNYEIDFDSKIFSCDVCNFTQPLFIIDSEYQKDLERIKEKQNTSPLKEIYEEQDILDGYESHLFLITLNNQKYVELKDLVEGFCKLKGIETFDISKYRNNTFDKIDTDEKTVYEKICQITRVPYCARDVKITFNIGIENIYNDYYLLETNYEKLKYKNRNKNALLNLKIGDYVNVKFELNDIFNKCKITNLTEYVIELEILKDKKTYKYSAPISNIIFINKIEKTKQC